MKFLGSLFAVLPIVLLGAHSVTSQSAADAVDLVNTITTISSETQRTCSEATAANFPTQDPEISAGLISISSMVEGFMSEYATSTPVSFSAADSKVLLEYAAKCVAGQTQLLGAVVQTHDLAVQYALEVRFGSAIGETKSAMEQFGAFFIARLDRSMRQEAFEQLGSLSTAFMEACNTFPYN